MCARHLTDSWIVLLIVVVGSVFAALIPPFQSPDEFDHVTRAYLLSRGQIILDVPEGQSSGGFVDTGLSAFMSAYKSLPFAAERKLSAAEIEAARGITWTGAREFRAAPGTGYYFPVIYLPQAVGLAVGEVLGLTVAASYGIARFAALSVAAILLFAAFSLYRPSPFAIALLIVPMSVFQFASASLDGVSTALAVFAVSAFFRLTRDGTNASTSLLSALTLAVTLLGTCRVHLVPMLALPILACYITGKRTQLAVAGLAVLLVISWLVIALVTTVDTRIAIGGSKLSIASFYIRQPGEFVDVLKATLSNSGMVLFYRDSFFGVLGWLDTRFREHEYDLFFVLTSLIGVLSISVRDLKTTWIPRLTAFTCAVASVLMMFFALLITWNPHPASQIQGVQGRYFLVPLILTAYAISGGLDFGAGRRRKVALALLCALGALTVFSMPRVLLERYYVQDGRVGEVSRPPPVDRAPSTNGAIPSDGGE